MASRLPAHFRAFPPTRTSGAPTPLHTTPQPPAAAHSAWCGAGGAVRGCEGWRRPPLCCSCSVMSGCYRSGRLVPVRAGCRGPGSARAVHSRAGRTAPPPPRLLGSGGSQFLHAKKRTLRPTLRHLQSAGCQPASTRALEWGEGERALHKGR